MIEVEQLLKPISAEEPCGKNLSYDPGFLALDGLIAGKPETQFSAAEEPDWKAVRDACLVLFNQSKDLRVAVTLSLALVKLEGAVGLRDGLALLKGMLEHSWPDVYPKLDPEEDNDPTERVNIIASLSTPLGTFGDPLRFLERLRQIPLAKEIDHFLTETVGSARAPDMGALTAVLTEIQKNLAPYMSSVPGQLQAEGQNIESDSTPGRLTGDGTVQSRQDVLRLLERICEYYERTEPSSPLPLLLRRAQRMAEMDFLQIVDELTPAMRAQLEPIVGVKPDGEKETQPS